MRYTKKLNSGELFDPQGRLVPQDDRVVAYKDYVRYLEGKGVVEIIDDTEEWDAAQASEPVEVLEDAAAWGASLVRSFEAAALAGGVNSNPAAALALDRYLREVSGALVAGRLHVAYAALAELLGTPEGERPAGAGDAALVPIHDALAVRLSLPPWGA